MLLTMIYVSVLLYTHVPSLNQSPEISIRLDACITPAILIATFCRVPGLEGQLREEVEARELERKRADELQAQQDKEVAQNELVRAGPSRPVGPSGSRLCLCL